MNRFYWFSVVLLFSFLSANCSSGSKAQERSEYAGQENREIKSLSESDIEQLRTGKGWGLAKAAELNGYPGPAHLIELKDKIELSKTQLEQVEGIFKKMQSSAIPLGAKLIDHEKELNELFAGRLIDEKSLAGKLEQIAGASKDLRFVHLAAHLEVTRILSAEQLAAYNNLRGYDSDNPCANVPEGHDPDMWKKHNNCY